MKKLKAFVSLGLCIALCYALNRNWGTVPPLGNFLSPFTGFWANAESPQAAANSTTLAIKGLQAPINVQYDEMGVAHIFAQNDHDLYLAQGYVTAKDRLWQMEFQTHYAAGRLTEIIGEGKDQLMLQSDRYQRRMGAVYGAEKSLEGMMKDPRAKAALEAYAEGINAYIASLSPRDYPFEYKLLGYAPEPWTPLKSALFLKNMSFVLASGTDDLRMTNILRKYGKAIAEDLFPNYPFQESPIIPAGTPLDFKPVPIPQAPIDFVGRGSFQAQTERDKGIGSNNWAVAGSKSATGLPLLANDPHLTLSLPSIWYQIQLHAPGINVYGSTMPGSPNVIIGFNNDIAWGVTNVGADVIDWYEVKFKDASLNEYWHDGRWKKIQKRLEIYHVKGGKTLVDTVLYTHHGPIVYLDHEKPLRKNIPTGHALRWIAHESSQEVTTFYLLNRAKNYDDYVKALSYYAAPAQNFVFASNQNDVALWVNGRFPLKAPQQGKYILDGTNPQADWQGYIPHEHNPHVKNPSRGFVSSANQFSTDPQYPYYINWEFAPAERGRRINARLGSMQKATTDSLRLLQNDNYNLRAADWRPVLTSLLAKPNAKQAKALELIKQWNLENNANEIAPTIFTVWMQLLQDAIWKDDFDFDEKIPMKYPSVDRTLALIKSNPKAAWFDNTQTKSTETLEQLVSNSLSASLDSLEKWQKAPLGEAWQWSKYKSTDIKHLIPGMDALSKMNVTIGGGAGIVNATTERTGPSWRMVVQLATQGGVQGYGVYPGGQSGNPGSWHYDDLIETWRKGELKPLLFLQNPQQSSDRIKQKLVFSKE